MGHGTRAEEGRKSNTPEWRMAALDECVDVSQKHCKELASANTDLAAFFAPQ